MATSAAGIAVFTKESHVYFKGLPLLESSMEQAIGCGITPKAIALSCQGSGFALSNPE
ncbi:MAG: hypothetical protein KME50_12385 [Nostoc desertorum CM1-VF14]|nr:hypothetical protein [Nostoc desertorum CM1-VF14]